MTRRFSFVFALVLAAFNMSHAETNDLFSSGLAAAQIGNFTAAQAAFSSESKRAPSAGALLNLGLAEWQRGHASAAILAWERLAWLKPDDKRAAQNLKFARAILQIEAPTLVWYEKLSSYLSPTGWWWLTVSSLWLLAGSLVLPRVLRWKKTDSQHFLTALALAICIFSLVANFGVISRLNGGVVLKKNAPLQLTPTHQGEVTSFLTTGESARKLKERGDFYFITTATATGWIARENFELIVPQ